MKKEFEVKNENGKFERNITAEDILILWTEGVDGTLEDLAEIVANDDWDRVTDIFENDERIYNIWFDTGLLDRCAVALILDQKELGDLPDSVTYSIYRDGEEVAKA